MTQYVLVTGSRDWSNFAAVQEAFATVDVTKATLVHGGAQGADAMAEHEWKKRGGTVIVQPADWKKYGRAAGPKRNETMVEDFPIARAFAFWKNGSRGTAHMLSVLKTKSIPVEIIYG